MAQQVLLTRIEYSDGESSGHAWGVFDRFDHPLWTVKPHACSIPDQGSNITLLPTGGDSDAS